MHAKVCRYLYTYAQYTRWPRARAGLFCFVMFLYFVSLLIDFHYSSVHDLPKE
jgi:hypothetical protein